MTVVWVVCNTAVHVTNAVGRAPYFYDGCPGTLLVDFLWNLGAENDNIPSLPDNTWEDKRDKYHIYIYSTGSSVGHERETRQVPRVSIHFVLQVLYDHVSHSFDGVNPTSLQQHTHKLRPGTRAAGKTNALSDQEQ